MLFGMELYYTEFLIAIAPLLPLVLRIGIPLRFVRRGKPRAPMASDQTNLWVVPRLGS